VTTQIRDRVLRASTSPEAPFDSFSEFAGDLDPPWRWFIVPITRRRSVSHTIAAHMHLQAGRPIPQQLAAALDEEIRKTAADPTNTEQPVGWTKA